MVSTSYQGVATYAVSVARSDRWLADLNFSFDLVGAGCLGWSLAIAPSAYSSHHGQNYGPDSS